MNITEILDSWNVQFKKHYNIRIMMCSFSTIMAVRYTVSKFYITFHHLSSQGFICLITSDPITKLKQRITLFSTSHHFYCSSAASFFSFPFQPSAAENITQTLSAKWQNKQETISPQLEGLSLFPVRASRCELNWNRISCGVAGSWRHLYKNSYTQN